MPLNLPPEAQLAWNKYLDANTTEEKILCLEEYLKLVPHHKGMANHLAQCRTRLAKLKAEQQAERLIAKSRITGEKWMIAKEGEAQIALLGIPNSGKSAFLNYLCQQEVTEVGEHPFTTIKPVVGTVSAKGALLQIVELPGVIEGASNGVANGSRIFAQARNADLIVLFLDMSIEPVDQLKLLLKELEGAKIRLNAQESKFVFERTSKGGQQILGADEYLEGGRAAAIDLLTNYRVSNCLLQFTEKTSLEELASSISMKYTLKKGLILASKGDLPRSKDNFHMLQNFVAKEYNNRFKIIAITTKYPVKKIDELTELLFLELGFIRVYTRSETGVVAIKPIVFTVDDAIVRAVAEKLGKTFLKNFRFARVWGKSIKFDGERVGIDHKLMDGDQIQIFA